MSDIRIISYLPNPRVYKATITARFSGAEIEVLGSAPPDMVDWLWDYDAKLMTDADKQLHSPARRTASTGFSGDLYKTNGFLAANPFGDIPAAFAEDGAVGVFESNSIMRLAALTGPNAPALYGDGPAQRARIDGFLDKTLLFADKIQDYILAGPRLDAQLHSAMARAFTSYCSACEAALKQTPFLAGDALSLADVVLACEMALLSNEGRMAEQLAAKELPSLLTQMPHYPSLLAHLQSLYAMPEFAADLADYAKFVGVVT